MVCSCANEDWMRCRKGACNQADCMILSNDGQLWNVGCNCEQKFICKKEKIPRSPPLRPPGWSDKCGWWWADNPSNDFCYLMGRKPTKTWKEARDECVRRRGDLLSITDSHEQAFIQGLLAFLPSAPSLWLGAYVTIAEDGGKWTDGSPLSYVHLNADHPGGGCLSLLTANGRWKVDDCQKKSGYICKRRGKGKTQEPARPHDGFMERLVCQNSPPNLWCLGEDQDERVIRIQSAFYGRRSGSVCPTVGGSNESCTVEGVLSHHRRHCDKRRKCHIALLKEKSRPAVSKCLEMVYSCEQKVCLDSLGIANRSIADWQFKASSSMSAFTPEKARLNGKSCWKPSQDANGSWIQVELDDMRKVTGIVTEGCSKYWGFKLEMKLSVDGRTWATHPDGQFIGGGTHVFGTPVSTKYIRILPLEVGVDFGLRFDILGCALDDVAPCGRKFNSLHVTNWKMFHCPPECANAKHKVFGTLIYDEDSSICAAAIHAGVIRNEVGGDCIVMRAPEPKVYEGSTRNGITSRYYNGPTALAFTFAEGELRCPEPDWGQFVGFCYKTFEDKKTWAHAQPACRGLGAELVSIRSKVEQAWVKKASNLDISDMWIGLNDLVDLGRFSWSDRQNVTFTHWAPGEPNNRISLAEDCVAMSRRTGRWKQMSCAQVSGFMCKMATAHYRMSQHVGLTK
ncbi:macrophage mannose receptor 1-like [Vanacampus margaritifer]